MLLTAFIPGFKMFKSGISDYLISLLFNSAKSHKQRHRKSIYLQNVYSESIAVKRFKQIRILLHGFSNNLSISSIKNPVALHYFGHFAGPKIYFIIYFRKSGYSYCKESGLNFRLDINISC